MSIFFFYQSFIFAVLLHFCSCYMIEGTWYGVHSPHNFWNAPVSQQAPTKFCTKVVVTYSPNPSCVSNLKLLPSMVCSRFKFLMLPAQTPANFCPKSCFLVSPSCIQNLKLLPSTVAKINRGPSFFGCSPSWIPANFGRKSCFLVSYTYAIVVHKLVTEFI